MMSDKAVPVERTPEKMARIASVLRTFEGRRGYPPNDLAFVAWCKAVSDIVYDKPNGWLWEKKNEDGTPRIEPNLGWIENDLDWLAEHAIAEFTFCPTPKHMRALYCTAFKVADGRQYVVEDLESL